jgi:hypothetical protein
VSAPGVAIRIGEQRRFLGRIEAQHQRARFVTDLGGDLLRRA